jgi:integrase/recombinase XerD
VIPVVSPEVEEFLVWLGVEKGRSQATLSAYRRDLEHYVAWLEHRGTTVLDASEDDVRGYLRSRQAEGLATSTITRGMVSVRSVHRFLVVEEVRTDDPTLEVGLPRVPRGLPKALSEQDIAGLLAAVEGSEPLALRDRAILEVLYGTGVRISELVGMSLGDIDLNDKMARVLGKGAKERVVPLGRYARDALVAYLRVEGRGRLEPERWTGRDDAEAVFLNARGGRLSRQGGWGVLKKYGAKVGLGSRLSPHTLRHCCATHMVEHGADIRTVQELLGHASITTTQIYTLVSRSQLVATYQAAHPRAMG